MNNFWRVLAHYFTRHLSLGSQVVFLKAIDVTAFPSNRNETSEQRAVFQNAMTVSSSMGVKDLPAKASVQIVVTVRSTVKTCP